jgi:hypothetical protein
MSDRKRKTGDNNEPDDDATSLGPMFTGRGLLSFRDCFDQMDGVHPADWQRENESEQR